ncbi:MAG: AraC-like DNA-binding protein [Paraglaciecola sp.]|jgi:AraC-like DNA-binding protein
MLKEVSNSINCADSKVSVLEDVFDVLRFKGSIFFSSSLSSPWGMSLSKVDSPRFHVALQGNFFIGTAASKNQYIEVNQMDIVVLPHGNMHWVADQTNRQLIPSEQAGAACELGQPLFQQGEITNRLMCGIVKFDKKNQHPILTSLPEALHFRNLAPNDPIWMMVMLLNAEISKWNNHQTPIVDRLTEALFLQLLNKYALEHTQSSGFFAALGNKRIHKLLSLVHQAPQVNWTLELLGEKVGMSRATLGRKFKDTLGMTPMAYIANWRLVKANHLLKYSNKSLEHVAEQVGFYSARTLSKAFSRQYGYTPSEMRRQMNTKST